MAFKRIVAKSEEDLEKILADVKEWFKSSKDYTVKFSKETRKFMDPETKKIVEKSIDVIEAKDTVNDKRATIKFIPMNEKNEIKLELGGEGETVVAGKISNQMKGRGTLKSYSKDKKVPLKENIMKKSELKQLIKEEILKVLNENEKYGIDDPRSLDELEKAIIKQMKVKESGNGNIKVSNEINILFSIYKNKGGKKTKKTLETTARDTN